MSIVIGPRPFEWAQTVANTPVNDVRRLYGGLISYVTDQDFENVSREIMDSGVSFTDLQHLLALAIYLRDHGHNNDQVNMICGFLQAEYNYRRRMLVPPVTVWPERPRRSQR